jgi:hypothetical protein
VEVLLKVEIMIEVKYEILKFEEYEKYEKVQDE